jgi:hypothetical protein
MTKVSSTYLRIGKEGEHCRAKCLMRRPLFISTLTRDCRTSAAKIKSRGERGSPCLTPLLHWKEDPGMLFKRTYEVADSRSCLIQVHQVCQKPLASSTAKMKKWSTLSKSFSKSSLRATTSFLDL